MTQQQQRHASQQYRRLHVRQAPAKTLRKTAENRYWERFRRPELTKQIGPVSYIEFSPIDQLDPAYAVTTSTRVMLYGGGRAPRAVSKFRDVAYSGSWRNDGKLLVAGGEEGHVRVFNAQTRAQMRQLPGHQGAVRVTRFLNDRVRIASAGNDATVRLWDLALAKQSTLMTGHTDYIRCGCVHPTTSDLFITGSYDHTIRVWDARTGDTSMTLSHGHPVEDVMVFPSGGILVSAGAQYIKVWDMLAGGRLLASCTNGEKTVTSLAFDASASRILAGSLDHRVKVYDITSYKVKHSWKLASPVLAVGVSPSNLTLAVGTADGGLMVRKRQPSRAPGSAGSEQRVSRTPFTGSYRYYVRGRSEAPSTSDFVVEHHRKQRLQAFDVHLKAFEYAAALDAALATSRPVVVISLIEELMQRGALHVALANRDEARIEPVLVFILRHITVPRYASLLIDVCNRVLDIYAPVLGRSPVIDELFLKLRARIAGELDFQKQMQKMLGSLSALLAVSSAAAHSGPSVDPGADDEDTSLMIPPE